MTVSILLVSDEIYPKCKIWKDRGRFYVFHYDTILTDVELINGKGAVDMDKDIDTMTCDEIKAEIIRMINEIDDEAFLEKIYHMLKKYLGME